MQQFESQYFSITDIWKSLCELHNDLFNLTCDEYVSLLNDDLDELHIIVEAKKNIIQRVNQLDVERSTIIDKINSTLSSAEKINSFNELIEFFSSIKTEQEFKHLFRFNALLIDIIEKIQVQNKKNQIYINQALTTIQSIRDEASGGKKFVTYNSKGQKTSKTNGLGATY
jgi:flagellar biosynthesis/type III secretory pathway chaperone